MQFEKTGVRTTRSNDFVKHINLIDKKLETKNGTKVIFLLCPVKSGWQDESFNPQISINQYVDFFIQELLTVLLTYSL